MATRLKHKEHGYLMAYGPAQVAELEALGWQIDASYDKPVHPNTLEIKAVKPAKQKHHEFHFADLIGHKDKE